MNGAYCLQNATYLCYTCECRESRVRYLCQYSPCMNRATCVHGATYLPGLYL